MNCYGKEITEQVKTTCCYSCNGIIVAIFGLLFTVAVGIISGAYLGDLVRNNIVVFASVTVVIFVLFIVSLIYKKCNCLRR